MEKEGEEYIIEDQWNRMENVKKINKKSRGGEQILKSRKKIELTKRDWVVLKVCFEQWFLVREQVMQWLMVSEKIEKRNTILSASFRVLDFLMREGLIEKHRFSCMGDRSLFNVTQKGISVLKDRGLVPDYAHYQSLEDGFLYHSFVTTEIRFLWEKETNIIHWTPERILHSENNDNVPDAEFYYDSAIAKRRIKMAVEVEISQKSQNRYEKKFRFFSKSDHDMVFYFVQSLRIKENVLSLSKEVCPKIFVCLISDLMEKRKEAILTNTVDTLTVGKAFL